MCQLSSKQKNESHADVNPPTNISLGFICPGERECLDIHLLILHDFPSKHKGLNSAAWDN